MKNKITFCRYIEEYNDSSDFRYYSDGMEILHLENIVYTINSRTGKVGGTGYASYVIQDAIHLMRDFPIDLLTHKIPKYIVARHKLSGSDIDTLLKKGV